MIAPDSTLIIDTVISCLDMMGAFVFALSGALQGYRRAMDLFGITVMATVTAIGGGTLRDLILNTPAFWLAQPHYLYLILGASVLVFLFADKIERTDTWLVWADGLGVAVFTVLGVNIALSHGVAPLPALMMGIITATFGGLMRDVLANKTPMVLLPNEVYATASLLGGIGYMVLLHVLPTPIAVGLGVALTFAIRGLAIYYQWRLPVRIGK